MTKGNVFKIILKIIVSVGLILILVNKMDIDGLLSILKRVNIYLLLIAGGLYFISQAISSYRWKVLLDSPISYARVFSYYFIGCFFNNFLPTSIGGDVVKTYYIYKENENLGKSMASVFIDRYVGLGGLLSIATLGIILVWKGIEATPVRWIYGLSMSGFIFVSSIMWAVDWGGFIRKLRVFYEPLMSYRKRKKLLLLGFGISLIIQLLVISGVYFVGLGIGVNVGFGYFAVLFPLATLVTMIPVSISGIGVREGAMAYLFGLVGIRVEAAVSMSVLWFVAVAAVNLIGGLEYLRTGSRIKKEQV